MASLTASQIAAVLRELNFKPPCECPRCLLQYRTLDQQRYIPFVYVGRVPDAGLVAEEYLQSIESDRAFLQSKIAESGLSILNRWRAGVGRRRALLEKTQPDLYAKRNPLIDIPSRVELLRHQREYRMGYMLPYLNVDDLSRDPTKFLGLLLHRTKGRLEDWVPFNNAMLWSGWKQCTLSEKSADGCITMHGEQFGKWSAFDPTAVHRNDACGAPRALMILESQQTLMKFLRDLTMVILTGSKSSKSLKAPANNTESARDATRSRDFEVCTEWLQFLNAEQKKDQPWLSFGEMFSNLPYTAAPTFDIETMIDIAENRANEAQDELWLLQTDMEYFYERSRHYEATWFDKMEKGPYQPKITAKQKCDNIGFIMTIKVVHEARDWQWLLSECQNVKRERDKSDSGIGPGKPMTESYERALSSLASLLWNSQVYHQKNLERFLIRSPAFTKLFKITGIARPQDLGTVFSTEVKDYATLLRNDRIGWCLYQLKSDFKERHVFEPSAVLQYLDEVLETCPRKEAERIDQEMQRCITELATILRMRKLVDLHRPSFTLPVREIQQEDRPAWQVLNRIAQNKVIVLATELGLGAPMNPLHQFRRPTGRKDENWLARRDLAHSALSNMWAKAREAYQAMLTKQGIPQEYIDPQLEWMRQCGSLENIAMLDEEKRVVLDRLQAAKERALARKAAPSHEGFLSVSAQQEAEAKYRVPETLKTKTKTRRAEVSGPDSLPDKIEDKAEETPPVLYKVKLGSTAQKVVSLMFPDRNEDIAKEKSSVDWTDVVVAMTVFGFRAEHRGGSAVTFRGEIMVPNANLTPEERSFNIHRPHPDSIMGPITLQSLGRRCNRRFGWQRGNFAIDEKDGK
ncbi:hypothetical protein BDR22DRAFT_375830 [Usnea florida]